MYWKRVSRITLKGKVVKMMAEASLPLRKGQGGSRQGLNDQGMSCH